MEKRWKKNGGGENYLDVENKVLGGYSYSRTYDAISAFVCDADDTNVRKYFDRIRDAKLWIEQFSGTHIEWVLDREEESQEEVYIGEGVQERDSLNHEKWGNMSRDQGCLSISQYAVRKVVRKYYTAFLGLEKVYKEERLVF